MSVSPTCNWRGALARPLPGRIAALLGAAAAVMLLSSPHAPAGEREGFWAQFHSFVPAAPQLKAPNLGRTDLWADDRAKARDAYRSGDFAAARKFLEKAAEQGDLVAVWYLGHMYRLGQGVKADNGKAFRYYGQIVQAFDGEEADPQVLGVKVDALVRVASYYRVGDTPAGIAHDPLRAFEIFKLASTYGHPAAQYAVGIMFFRGEGVKRNSEQGLRWLVLAARKRYAPAEAALGDIYWAGQNNVRQDRAHGLMWYLLAQRSVRPEENPEIIDRFDRLMVEASEAERRAAETQAAAWATQFPVPPQASQ